jgi:hypothetical protein
LGTSVGFDPSKGSTWKWSACDRPGTGRFVELWWVGGGNQGMNKFKFIITLCVAGAGILAFGLSQSSAHGGSQAAISQAPITTATGVHHEDPPPNVVDLSDGRTPVSVADADSRGLCEVRIDNSVGLYGAKDAEVRWAGKMTVTQNRDWVRGYSGGSIAPDISNVQDPNAVFTLCIYTGHFYGAAPPVPKPMGTVIEMGFYLSADASMTVAYMSMEQSAWQHPPTPEEVSAVGLLDPPPAPKFEGP